jgi:cytochrome c-type biogenesis protein CcmH
MTVFIIVAAAMVAAALLWLLFPLLRGRRVESDEPNASGRWISAAAVAFVVPLLAVVMYTTLSNWEWSAVEADTARTEQLDGLLKQLEARLQSNPEDLAGWLLLGRSYASMQRLSQATQAYQRAYDLSRGEDVEAVLGLGEALVMEDESTLAGRAGRLFDEALILAPNHPKALWYGSLAALQAGDLRKGRDRLQHLLEQEPPEELRTVLQRQIQDLNEQIGETNQPKASQSETSQPAAGEGAAQAVRTIKVAVTIAPEIERQLTSPLPLFVLARDPAGGAPLAVQRLSSSQLPLTVELSERDAMMPTHTIASAKKIQVVARLSKAGTPQARSGDFFGQADYEFGKDVVPLNIRIDQVVP